MWLHNSQHTTHRACPFFSPSATSSEPRLRNTCSFGLCSRRFLSSPGWLNLTLWNFFMIFIKSVGSGTAGAVHGAATGPLGSSFGIMYVPISSVQCAMYVGSDMTLFSRREQRRRHGRKLPLESCSQTTGSPRQERAVVLGDDERRGPRSRLDPVVASAHAAGLC